ncbi:MAG: hypothetical protein ACRCWQ_11195, partial [Bacilli bacterium]
MSSFQRSTITYEMQEYIRFPKGFSVEEILSLQLNPEVEVRKEEDMVIIEGVIVLEGEYVPFEAEQQTEEPSRQIANIRDADEVAAVENGT